MFYKVDEETEMVYVVRIMYSGRDIHKLLRQTEDVLGTWYEVTFVKRKYSAFEKSLPEGIL